MKKRAFTLIELLVVIVIIGALVLLISTAVTAVQRQVQAAPAATTPFVTDPHSVPYGISVYTYRGNEYIVVRGSESTAICPALPPKAEKEPGHAE